MKASVKKYSFPVDEVESSYRRVQVARWLADKQQYSVHLFCGHAATCSDVMLGAQMLCMECLKKALGPHEDDLPPW